MKAWKKIVKVVVAILARMTMREKVPRKPSAVSVAKGDMMLPAASMASAVRNVSAPAVVTFGRKFSEPLSRSEVLSWLRADCKASRRKIDLLVLHCSDTKPSQRFTIEGLIASHKARGFGSNPGYHVYVRRDGTMYYCRPVADRGCHVAGWNATSVGVCYEGGHSDDPSVRYEDNRTAEQMVVLHEVLSTLHECYPEARIVGHHELNPKKLCPCLERPAEQEYAYLMEARR